MRNLNKKNIFNLTSFAQGTIEYLVILAVIIVISLIVVALFIGVTNSPSQQVIESSSEIKDKIGVGGISIVDSIVGEDGNGLLVLKNMDSDNLTLTKIIVDGVDHNFSENLVFGSEKSFLLQDIVSCDGTALVKSFIKE